MELVPQGDRLVVEARVEPSDVDVVHSGLPAQVKLVAFNQRYAPALDGRIKWVSADRLTDERTGLPYYIARVELEGGQEALLADETLYPGMPAEVMIVTGSRTMLDYLVSPLFRAIDRAGREG
jgi:multidrug efflux pump subunit AcrA (membrane-fusion protein)